MVFQAENHFAKLIQKSRRTFVKALDLSTKNPATFQRQGSIVLAGILAKVKGARHTWFPREITPAEHHS